MMYSVVKGYLMWYSFSSTSKNVSKSFPFLATPFVVHSEQISLRMTVPPFSVPTATAALSAPKTAQFGRPTPGHCVLRAGRPPAPLSCCQTIRK